MSCDRKKRRQRLDIDARKPCFSLPIPIARDVVALQLRSENLSDSVLRKGHARHSIRIGEYITTSLHQSSSCCCIARSRWRTVNTVITATITVCKRLSLINLQPPQGMKYFTIIGPHIDCMEDQYLVSLNALVGPSRRKSAVTEPVRACTTRFRLRALMYVNCLQKPLVGRDKRAICCLCCQRGVVRLKSALERSAYCCGKCLTI